MHPGYDYNSQGIAPYAQDPNYYGRYDPGYGYADGHLYDRYPIPITHQGEDPEGGYYEAGYTDYPTTLPTTHPIYDATDSYAYGAGTQTATGGYTHSYAYAYSPNDHGYSYREWGRVSASSGSAPPKGKTQWHRGSRSILITAAIVAAYGAVGVGVVALAWLLGGMGPFRTWHFILTFSYGWLAFLIFLAMYFLIARLAHGRGKWPNRRRKRIKAIHIGVAAWTALFVCITATILATTAAKITVAEELGKEGAMGVANCYDSPSPKNGQKDWEEKVEFMRWSQEFYIDKAALQTHSEGNEQYCVAPIRLRVGRDPALGACRGYRAYAACYQDVEGGGCTEEGLKACGWDRSTELVVSRVLAYSRRHIYSEGPDDSFRKAAEKVKGSLLMSGSTADAPIVWWDGEHNPGYYRQKREELGDSAFLQCLLYPIGWLMGCLLWALCTCTF